MERNSSFITLVLYWNRNDIMYWCHLVIAPFPADTASNDNEDTSGFFEVDCTPVL